jgi:SPP1 Gp6-like portal protein
MTQTMTRPASVSSAQQPAQPTYEITEADKKRQKKIADAWKAYNDELDKPLVPMPDEPDDNVMSNRCQPVVDAGVDFLFGKEIEISCEESVSQAAQDFLNATWGTKEYRIPLLQEWAMNGAMAGEGFLRIMPYDDGTFEIVVIDPSTVFVKTAPQNCKKVLLFCIQYSEMERVNGQVREVFYREEIAANYPEPASGRQAKKPTSWTIQHWTQIGNTGMQPKLNGWTPAGEPYPWPYSFPPLFGNQNLPSPNDYWGRPDITPGLIGLNNALNLTNSCANRNLKMFGSPILWGVGFAESSIAVQPGRIMNLGDMQGKIDAVKIQADIPSSIAFAAQLRSDIDELSHVPGVATGRIEHMPRGNMSGIAIELLFMPLLKKTETKQCLYGKSIIEVSRALLTLNNMRADI